jgi:hypothetical protein
MAKKFEWKTYKDLKFEYQIYVGLLFAMALILLLGGMILLATMSKDIAPTEFNPEGRSKILPGNVVGGLVCFGLTALAIYGGYSLMTDIKNAKTCNANFWTTTTCVKFPTVTADNEGATERAVSLCTAQTKAQYNGSSGFYAKSNTSVSGTLDVMYITIEGESKAITLSTGTSNLYTVRTGDKKVKVTGGGTGCLSVSENVGGGGGPSPGGGGGGPSPGGGGGGPSPGGGGGGPSSGGGGPSPGGGGGGPSSGGGGGGPSPGGGGGGPSPNSGTNCIINWSSDCINNSRTGTVTQSTRSGLSCLQVYPSVIISGSTATTTCTPASTTGDNDCVIEWLNTCSSGLRYGTLTQPSTGNGRMCTDVYGRGGIFDQTLQINGSTASRACDLGLCTANDTSSSCFQVSLSRVKFVYPKFYFEWSIINQADIPINKFEYSIARDDGHELYRPITTQTRTGTIFIPVLYDVITSMNRALSGSIKRDYSIKFRINDMHRNVTNPYTLGYYYDDGLYYNDVSMVFSNSKIVTTVVPYTSPSGPVTNSLSIQLFDTTGTQQGGIISLTQNSVSTDKWESSDLALPNGTYTYKLIINGTLRDAPIYANGIDRTLIVNNVISTCNDKSTDSINCFQVNLQGSTFVFPNLNLSWDITGQNNYGISSMTINLCTTNSSCTINYDIPATSFVRTGTYVLDLYGSSITLNTPYTINVSINGIPRNVTNSPSIQISTLDSQLRRRSFNSLLQHTTISIKVKRVTDKLDNTTNSLSKSNSTGAVLISSWGITNWSNYTHLKIPSVGVFKIASVGTYNIYIYPVDQFDRVQTFIRYSADEQWLFGLASTFGTIEFGNFV